MSHVISSELGYEIIMQGLNVKIKRHEDILRECHEMKRVLKDLNKKELELEDARIRAESELKLAQKQKKVAHEKASKLLLDEQKATFDKVQWPTHESPDVDPR